MLPRALFRAAALQGRQQQLLSPSRARAALFAAAKTQVVAYSSSSQRGDADGQDGGSSEPRSYKASARLRAY
ncbi:emp24/gp25L/p24 family/GOLD-domain-containing protein [Apiospora arundinis]